jgi:bacterioferritin
MEDETLHAQSIIRRILMLSGTPKMTVNAINIGATVPEMLQLDLELEYQVQQHLKDGIALCEAERDYVTREMLVEQLKDTEEDHAHWLEQQLRLIEMISLPNYLQSQMAEVTPNLV